MTYFLQPLEGASSFDLRDSAMLFTDSRAGNELVRVPVSLIKTTPYLSPYLSPYLCPYPLKIESKSVDCVRAASRSKFPDCAMSVAAFTNAV